MHLAAFDYSYTYVTLYVFSPRGAAHLSQRPLLNWKSSPMEGCVVFNVDEYNY